MNEERKKEFFSYLLGVLTATMLIGSFAGFLGYKVGFGVAFNKLREVILPSPSQTASEITLRIPEPVLTELTQGQAVYSNANNPTRQAEHDTVLVHPDSELGYVMYPNVSLAVDLLRSPTAINLDPPVLHRKSGQVESLDLKNYLNKESLLSYSYNTNSLGQRRTLPEIQSDKKILVIGDSVAFGVGVNDEDTAASYLQTRLGSQYQIVNAGVGGYNGGQAFLMAKRLAQTTKFAGLVYIVCQNDFMDGEDWETSARETMTKIESLSKQFDGKVMVFFHTYLEYNARDFFLDAGWSDSFVRKTSELRNLLPDLARQYGFAYADWSDEVADFSKRERSIFARFALYTDHCHLSPLGNRLMANLINARFLPVLQREN